MVLGIPDPWVWGAYMACIVSAVLCVVWGLVKWNSDADEIKEEDRQWAEHEDKIEEKL